MTTSERRPPVREAALKSTATTTTCSVADLSRRDLDLFLAGYASGYGHGLDAGRVQADADAAALHAASYRIVQAAAKIDPWPITQEARRGRQEAAARASRATSAPWAREAS